MIMTQKHSHYFKPVPVGVTHIDVYRVLELFGVTDPCIQHAVKKLLVAGGRGPKDIAKDIQEAIDTLERRMAMWNEVSSCARSASAVTAEPHDTSDGWIEWGGGKCPVPIEFFVEVKIRDGRTDTSGVRANSFRWMHVGDDGDIIAYRVVRSGN